MTTRRACLARIRHKLLEGVLIRLSAHSDADDYIVRGGLLLRHWFHPRPRPTKDLDLIVTSAFDSSAIERRWQLLFAEEADDGVTYDLDRIRYDVIWPETHTPGVRVFVSGTAEGVEQDVHIDLTFGPLPRPAAAWMELPTERGVPVGVWACRPEAVAAQKAQALWRRGNLGWRPKDLYDLHGLLTDVPMTPAVLQSAVLAYLADLGAGPADAHDLFGLAAWWGQKRSSARWQDFTRSSELSTVIADVKARWATLWEDS